MQRDATCSTVALIDSDIASILRVDASILRGYAEHLVA
jgi:hypothetical protein